MKVKGCFLAIALDFGSEDITVFVPFMSLAVLSNGPPKPEACWNGMELLFVEVIHTVGTQHD